MYVNVLTLMRMHKCIFRYMYYTYVFSYSIDVVMDEKRGSARGSSRGGRENIQGKSYIYMHVCKLKLDIYIYIYICLTLDKLLYYTSGLCMFIMYSYLYVS
jgi:hypothetical protein